MKRPTLAQVRAKARRQLERFQLKPRTFVIPAKK